MQARLTEWLGLMRRHQLGAAYVVLGVLVVVAIVGADIWPRTRLANEYGPNLATELVGILITLVLVERMLRWQRQRELQPIRAVAGKRFRTPIAHVLHVVASMYKAAADPEEAIVPASVDELLTRWPEVAPRLDFQAPAPIYPTTSWAAYLGPELRRLQTVFDETVARYAEALGEGIIVATEELLQNPIWGLMSSQDRGAELQATLDPPLPFFLALHSPGGERDLEVFALRVQTLVLQCEALVGQPIGVPEIWRHDISPAVGSSRWVGDLTSIEDERTYMRRGSLAEMPEHASADEASGAR